ncbi:hypothetical protein H6787_03080 [Candidatus Nomurabacteria bacterium]|nr:hypothetical protein [Candidatus Nomurabacteria bacterium]MCB9818443.1 hypothetical protein [Candidatus Nomurabacteria bacterium]
MKKLITKADVLMFVIGLLLGAIISGIFFAPEKTQVILSSFQAMAVTLVTIFTAWWTSKTFGHELRSREAKEILGVLLSMRNCVNEITNPIASMPIIGKEATMDNFMEKWEENKEKVSEEAWYRYLGHKGVLKEITEKSVALKPFTRMQLLMIGDFKDDMKNIKEDNGQKLTKDIIALQAKIAREAHFDVGIEVTRIRNKLGLWFS